MPPIAGRTRYEQNLAVPSPLQGLQMIPDQVQIPDRVFDALLDRTNTTDEARKFRALCESARSGGNAGSGTDRSKMASLLLQALSDDPQRRSLEHVQGDAYGLVTPDAATHEDRLAQQAQIQGRIDQVARIGAAASGRAPAAQARPRTVLDELAESPDPDTRQNARLYQAHQAAMRDRPKDPKELSLAGVARDVGYAFKSGILNMLRGGGFMAGFDRALASGSNPFVKEVGITRLSTHLERDLKRTGQPVGKLSRSMEAPSSGVRPAQPAQAAGARPVVQPNSTALHYTAPQFSGAQGGQLRDAAAHAASSARVGPSA